MSPRWGEKVFAGNCLRKTLCSSTEITARFLGGVRGLGNPDPEQLTETAREPDKKIGRINRPNYSL